MQPQNKRFFCLDVLRGLSALLIVLYHYTARYLENPITDNPAKGEWMVAFPWGCAAVSTFFILSGFLIAKHIFPNSDSKVAPGQVVQFLKGRVVRLYPAFVVAMFTTIVFLYWGFGVHFSLMQILCNLTMLPALFGQYAIDGVYWTLQVELFFYIGVAAIMLLGSVRIKKVALLLWTLTPLFTLIPSDVVSTIINVIFICNYISAFAAGIAIYFITQRGEMCYSILLLIISFVSQVFIADVAHIVFFVLTIALIYLATKFNSAKVGDNLLVKALKWIGDISYPLYLVHQMVGFTILYYIQTTFAITAEWVVVVPIIFSVVYAYVIHKYVEGGGQRLIKR